jgi:hypothetical protein
MTQDPYGQPPGTGHVVRSEIVPDDEANVIPPTAPMTQFQKVASALRGDRTDPTVPAHVASDAATATSQGTQDAAQDDATGPEEVIAVRSPDAGSRDYWENADEAGPKEAAPEAAAPREAPPEEAAPGEPAAAGADAVGAGVVGAGAAGAGAAGAGAAGAEAAGADAAGAEAAGAEAAGAEAAGAEAVGAGAVGAGAATQDPTMTQPDLYGAAARAQADTERSEADTARSEADTATAGAGEPEVVGKHAGAPAREGLRPGESGDGLGDFSDLTFGSLLPDAAEFKAQWHQVQFRFVDDPRGSVTEAADVVAQVTAKLEAAIAERQRAIAERQRALRSRWSEGKSTDTESLRETLLMYRAFLDQLTGPKDG